MSMKRKNKSKLPSVAPVASGLTVVSAPALAVAPVAPVALPLAAEMVAPVVRPSVEAVPVAAAVPVALEESATVVADGSLEDRRARIAQKAFERAMAFGLGSTDPVADWLWAEQEIERESRLSA